MKRLSNIYFTIEQQIKVKKNSGKLFNQLYDTKSLLVINDEKYFCFAVDNMPGNSGYYKNIKETCPEDVCFVGKEKFQKKLFYVIVVCPSHCFILPRL